MSSQEFITADPERVYEEICTRATREILAGATRLSMRRIVEEIRSGLKIKINSNDITSWTDRWRWENPDFAHLIQVRDRGTRGKNKPADLAQNEQVRAWIQRAYQIGVRHGRERANLEIG